MTAEKRVIDPIREGRATGAVIYDYVVKKADGSPGAVENPPTFTAEPAELLNVFVRNPSQGVWEAEFVHNGSVGQAVVTASAVDGDLGEGILTIGPFTDTVEVRGELVQSPLDSPHGHSKRRLRQQRPRSKWKPSQSKTSSRRTRRR